VPILVGVGRILWVAARTSSIFVAKSAVKTPSFLLWFGIGSATTVVAQIDYKKYILGAVAIFLLYKKMKK
jgi:hypothetical protein